jgi:hypothetical protein
MSIMDRVTFLPIIIKYYTSRLTQFDITLLIKEYCKEVNKPEYIAQLLQIPGLFMHQIVDYIIDYYSYKYNIIFIHKFIPTKQLLKIY